MKTETTIKTIKLENHNTTITIVEMKEKIKLDPNVLWTNTPFKSKFFVTLDGEHIIKNQNDYCNQIGNEAYLNDVIEDGYTEFEFGLKVQPRVGKILLFPATWQYLHRGYPPKSETKYLCTGWLYFAS